MKSLLRLAARFYPRAWRDRHGEAFDALIDDLTPRWRHFFDIVIGALIMQISRVTLVPLAMAAAGAIVGMALALVMPPVYASSSWVLVQVPDTSADASERGQRIMTAIEAALQETALDKKSIAVTLRGEPGRNPVLLEVSASGGSAQAAQQAAVKAMGSIIEGNFVASDRLPRNAAVQFVAVQPPNLPQTAQRETIRMSAVGGGLGFLIGAVFWLAGHRWRRTTPGVRGAAAGREATHTPPGNQRQE